ncbi:MAG TPA: hypothetical protein PK528_14205 [Syntrophorhabdus sp.]|nr:hypothetical protein [Syntrophorhabdus sp.]
MELVDKVLRGDEGSAARLISMIEEGRDEGYEAIPSFFLTQARRMLSV